MSEVDKRFSEKGKHSFQGMPAREVFKVGEQGKVDGGEKRGRPEAEILSVPKGSNPKLIN